MHTAPASNRHTILYAALAAHLRTAGATIRYSRLHDADGRWHARSKTLTLRTDATTEDHIAVLGDLIRMTLLGEPPLRAQPLRHLHAVPG